MQRVQNGKNSCVAQHITTNNTLYVYPLAHTFIYRQYGNKVQNRVNAENWTDVYSLETLFEYNCILAMKCNYCASRYVHNAHAY